MHPNAQCDPAGKDGRGQQQGWLQVDKKVHQKMWQFWAEEPDRLGRPALPHQSVAPWNKRRRHELCSNGRSHGDCRQDGEKPLSLRLRTPVSFRSSNPASRTFTSSIRRWHGREKEGHGFAAFNSEIVLAEQEANRAGGQADRGRQGVGNGSATGAGERFLVGNEDTPPPDQLEMHLP